MTCKKEAIDVVKNLPLKVYHNRGTFCFQSYKLNRRFYFIISISEPWFLPKIDRNYLSKMTLIGWLFIYFGWDNEYLIKAYYKGVDL